MTTGKLKFWGWGREGEGPDAVATQKIAAALARRFGMEKVDVIPPPRIEELDLRAPRVERPEALRSMLTDDASERARHTFGRSYRDLVRAFRRDFREPPDWVAFPQNEQAVIDLLDWCGSKNIAAIPFGGGSSVVGGVECSVGDEYAGVVSIDLTRLNQVVEIDRVSRAARIQAGIYGPALEDALRPQGLTLRHFPQSFEFSTLGGWVATRAGGHFATVYTHIDDLVQSTRAITPSGLWESRRLPGSGAGPSPDRLMLGSEGIFGVITEAWMRVRPRPVFRATATSHFADYGRAVEAVRVLSQSGLYPSNCRLLDKREAALNAVTLDGTHVLIVAFESADHPVRAWMDRALELIADQGGTCPKGPVFREGGERSGGSGGADAWRDAFIDAPYLLNTMASMGVIADTFETACTWDNFERLHSGVVSEVRQAMKDACGAGFISCRFTHVYPDGPAPYFTFIAPGRYGAEAEQWMTIKKAASDAVIAHGGTITHHHAVGRVHRPWYEKQRPAPFGDVLRAVKGALDPGAVMNPGVLIEPVA
jgi:alkyldihydroxyacetonephosphate synthase